MHANLHTVDCKLSQLWTMRDKLCGQLLTDGVHACTLVEVASGKGHAQTMLQRFSSLFGCKA